MGLTPQAGIYMEVRIDATAALRELDRLGAKLTDIKPGLALVGEAAATMVQGHFDTRTDENGAAWPPNAPVTAALKGSSIPLTDKGHLKQSVYSKSPTANYVDVTVREKEQQKARVHDRGAVITAKNKRVLAREVTKAKANKAMGYANKNGFGGVRLREPKGSQKQFVVFGKSVTIPRRQFMYLNSAEREKCARILCNWASGGMSADFPMSRYGVLL